MPEERTYSTREVAQMWNVSESTVKRWADTSGLHCYRTPGGHRKFRPASVGRPTLASILRRNAVEVKDAFRSSESREELIQLMEDLRRRR